MRIARSLGLAHLGVPLLAAGAWAGLAGAEGGIRVSDAWVRAAPSVVQVHAAYLTISNHGSNTRQLVGVESRDYAKVELHASQVTNGVATMAPVAQVEIAAEQAVRFAPGGLHLMLIGPKTAPPPGGEVSLTLVFDDGTRLPVSASVRQDAAGPVKGRQGHGQHRGHHHGH
jgi:copper(I)-binding protein